MCGRYTLADPKAVAAAMLRDFGVIIDSESPRYNVAPSQPVPIIRCGESGKPGAVQMRWGMIPWWDKSPRPRIAPINARSEEAFSKPLFRRPLQRRRALFPCDGFFEWQASEAGPKKPHYIGLAGGEPFVIAGIYEEPAAWRPEPTCALLTVGANELMSPIHNRMPVILDVSDAQRWLRPGPMTQEDMTGICRPFPAARMRARAVSTIVNNVRNDSPDCVTPV